MDILNFARDEGLALPIHQLRRALRRPHTDSHALIHQDTEHFLDWLLTDDISISSKSFDFGSLSRSGVAKYAFINQLHHTRILARLKLAEAMLKTWATFQGYPRR